MSIRPWPVLAWAVALALSPAFRALAGDPCDRCGCAEKPRQVCRLVKEEKKVQIVCWGVKEEDFCLPGPGKPGCEHAETVCASCAATDPQKVQGASKRFVWTDWIPGCSDGIYTKKKLMKKTITKTIPSYKWVVEEVCRGCAPPTKHALIEPGSVVPPAPPGFEQAREEALAQSALVLDPPR